MAKILIGNVKPVKGVDYFTPADIDELSKKFATKESLEETQEEVAGLDAKYAPAYTFGTEDLEAGTTPLETGRLHFVYEE